MADDGLESVGVNLNGFGAGVVNEIAFMDGSDGYASIMSYMEDDDKDRKNDGENIDYGDNDDHKTDDDESEQETGVLATKVEEWILSFE